MTVLRLTRDEFDYLRALQIRYRWDWPAVFSTNCHGEIWPFAGYGFTPKAEREDVRGLSQIIDQVADSFVQLRAEGGGFFIDGSGALHRANGRPERFLDFEIKTPVQKAV